VDENATSGRPSLSDEPVASSKVVAQLCIFLVTHLALQPGDQKRMGADREESVRGINYVADSMMSENLKTASTSYIREKKVVFHLGHPGQQSWRSFLLHNKD